MIETRFGFLLLTLTLILAVSGQDSSINEPQNDPNAPNKAPAPGPPAPPPGGWGPPQAGAPTPGGQPGYYPMFAMVGVEAETNATTYSKKEATIKEESGSSYQSKAGGMGLINVKEPRGSGGRGGRRDGDRGGKKQPGGKGKDNNEASGDTGGDGGGSGGDESPQPKGGKGKKDKETQEEEKGKSGAEADPDAADSEASTAAPEGEDVENDSWEQPEYELEDKKNLNAVFGGSCKPDDWTSCKEIKDECPAGPGRDFYCMKHGENMYKCVIECIYKICGDGNSRIDMKFAGHEKSRIKGAGKCDAQKKPEKKS